MTDTPPEIAEMVRVRMMTKSGAERFRMGAEMFEAARRMMLASFPEVLTEEARRRMLFERTYGIPFPPKTGCDASTTGGSDLQM